MGHKNLLVTRTYRRQKPECSRSSREASAARLRSRRNIGSLPRRKTGPPDRFRVPRSTARRRGQLPRSWAFWVDGTGFRNSDRNSCTNLLVKRIDCQAEYRSCLVAKWRGIRPRESEPESGVEG